MTQFDEAFAAWLRRAQAQINDYYAATFPTLLVPTLTVERGKRYVRVIRDEGNSRSAFAFVDITTGDVLKPAGWKGPAKGARGNIYTPRLGVSAYGALYAR